MSKFTTKNFKDNSAPKAWKIAGMVGLILVFFVLEILEMKDVIEIPKVLGVNGIGIRTYGFLITTGVVIVSTLVASEFAKYKELKKVEIADVLLYALIFGVIGARLYHLITDWGLYASEPIRALYFWNGGLGIYGAVVGGVLGLWLYARKKKFQLSFMLDIIAVFMPIAQIIGRTGNLINEEIVGLPTSLPWAWNIQSLNGSFHPVFLYEQLGNLILFLALLVLYKKKSHLVGTFTYIMVYLGGYSLVRFIVEFWRIEPKILLETFSTNQIVSFFGIIIAAIFLIKKFKFQKKNL